MRGSGAAGARWAWRPARSGGGEKRERSAVGCGQAAGRGGSASALPRRSSSGAAQSESWQDCAAARRHSAAAQSPRRTSSTFAGTLYRYATPAPLRRQSSIVPRGSSAAAPNVRDHDKTLLLARAKLSAAASSSRVLFGKVALESTSRAGARWSRRCGRPRPSNCPFRRQPVAGCRRRSSTSAKDSLNDALEEAIHADGGGAVDRDPDLAIFQVMRQEGNEQRAVRLQIHPSTPRSRHCSSRSAWAGARLTPSARSRRLMMNISMLESCRASWPRSSARCRTNSARRSAPIRRSACACSSFRRHRRRMAARGRRAPRDARRPGATRTGCARSATRPR